MKKAANPHNTSGAFAPKGDPELREDAVRILVSHLTDQQTPRGKIAFAKYVEEKVEALATNFNEWTWQHRNSPRLPEVAQQLKDLEAASRKFLGALNGLHPQVVWLLRRGGHSFDPDHLWIKRNPEEYERTEQLKSLAHVDDLERQLTPELESPSALSQQLDALVGLLVQAQGLFTKEYLGEGEKHRDRGGRRNFFTEHGGTPIYKLAMHLRRLYLDCRPLKPPAVGGPYHDLVVCVSQYATGRDDETGIDFAIRKITSAQRHLDKVNAAIDAIVAKIWALNANDPEREALLAKYNALYDEAFRIAADMGSHAIKRHLFGRTPPRKRKPRKRPTK